MILAEKNKNSVIELISYSVLHDDSMLIDKYHKWLEDIDVVRFIGSEQLLFPKQKDFIAGSFKRFTGENAIGFFIRYVPNDVFIGTTKLDQISYFHRSAWDGIMIGEKEYWGKGLGFHVYRLLLAYAFQVLGLNRVTGGCNEHNIPMIKTFEKSGYVQEGKLRKKDFINGSYSDHLYFGILRNEFIERHDVKLF